MNQARTVGIPMMEIPRMPALWDKNDVLVTCKGVAGALAHWATQQSPYAAPANLTDAVIEFMGHWPIEDFARVDSRMLYEAVQTTIDKCPLIVAWNTPKIEGAVNPQFGAACISRYESIKPDYDFIDLGALARNITHELVLWSQVEAAQDATREGVAL